MVGDLPGAGRDVAAPAWVSHLIVTLGAARRLEGVTLKVFVSSLISGFQEFRNAAEHAARTLDHEVLMAEHFGARSDSPQQACLGAAREADVVLVVLGERYGDVQPSGLSATHEEYKEAVKYSAVLVFVQKGIAPEPRQADFIAETRPWQTGGLTGGFSDPESLRDEVTRALARHQLATVTGAVDPDALVGRARGALPERSASGEGQLLVSIAGGPPQMVLRPGELEDESLARVIRAEALTGELAVLDPEDGTKTIVRQGRLSLSQPSRFVTLDGEGTITIGTPAVSRHRDATAFAALIEEDILVKLERMLRFGAFLLERIDPVQRVTRVAPVVSLMNAGYAGWQDKTTYESTRGSVVMGRGGELITVQLTPPDIARPLLAQKAASFAEDLTVLLRREVKG